MGQNGVKKNDCQCGNLENFSGKNSNHRFCGDIGSWKGQRHFQTFSASPDRMWRNRLTEIYVTNQMGSEQTIKQSLEWPFGLCPRNNEVFGNYCLNYSYSDDKNVIEGCPILQEGRVRITNLFERHRVSWGRTRPFPVTHRGSPSLCKSLVPFGAAIRRTCLKPFLYNVTAAREDAVGPPQFQ